MHLLADAAAKLHSTLLDWYAQNRRDLPWRRTRDPYRILVSEIMLQQTQVSRVVPKLEEWLQLFPTVTALANATKREVLVAWSGMGYNRRALNIHRVATEIQNSYRGEIPADLESLCALPGIGKYTASAVMCFAFRRKVPVVDINIRRVISRVTLLLEHEDELLPETEAWTIAADMLPDRAYFNWNQALMDLGAAVCTKRSPGCTVCPVSQFCKSSGNLEPMKIERSSSVREVPRRIYRGKVIELLRSNNGRKGYSFEEIGRTLRAGFSEKHHDWLVDILHTLEADEMIIVKRNGRSIMASEISLDLASITVHLVE